MSPRTQDSRRATSASIAFQSHPVIENELEYVLNRTNTYLSSLSPVELETYDSQLTANVSSAARKHLNDEPKRVMAECPEMPSYVECKSLADYLFLWLVDEEGKAMRLRMGSGGEAKVRRKVLGREDFRGFLVKDCYGEFCGQVL